MSTNSFPTSKEKALAKKARPKSVLKDTLPTPRFRGMASTLHMHTATSPGKWQPWTLGSVIASVPFLLGYAIWWVFITQELFLRILGGLRFAARFSASWPYFKPKNVIFQTWPRRNYYDKNSNKKGSLDFQKSRSPRGRLVASLRLLKNHYEFAYGISLSFLLIWNWNDN